MSPSTVHFLAIVCCSVIACCSGNADITAYVREELMSTTCVSVPQIDDVCSVNYKLKENDAESYNDTIKTIKDTLSMDALYHGLSIIDKMHCRTMYENMICKNAFPVCDTTRMVIDYGDAKARCISTKEACTTIGIQGCEDSTGSRIEPLIPEPNKCVSISANTSILCPGPEVKVPDRYVSITKTHVEEWSKIAKLFSKELETRSITAECEMKYREVLCRLIDACSQDSLYYLHYISLSECEETVSCVKSAGFSEDITSICSKVPITEDAESITVPNPYVPPEMPTDKVSTTKMTVPTTKISIPTTKEQTIPTTKEDAIPATKEETIPTTKEETIPTTKEKTFPTTKEETATSELLSKPEEDNNKADKVSSNNTKSDVENKGVHGSASKNYQNLYLFTMVVALCVGQAFY